MPLIAAAMAPAHTSEPPPNSIDPDGEFPLGPPEYFFYLLFQAARHRDLNFDRDLAPTGLNLAQWRSLAIIRRIEGCTMSLLARYSTVDRTTLTRSVDQLVARGLVERWTPERDRRQVSLALSDLGEATYGKAVAILRDRNQAVLADVDSRRLREATRVLQTTLARLVADAELSDDLITFGRRLPVENR
jgi:DNA-binding MarR family transcriptional regulator